MVIQFFGLSTIFLHQNITTWVVMSSNTKLNRFILEAQFNLLFDDMATYVAIFWLQKLGLSKKKLGHHDPIIQFNNLGQICTLALQPLNSIN